MGGSDSVHSIWGRNKKWRFQVLPDLNIDIVLCFQAIIYFLLHVFSDVQLDLHTKSSFIVIGISLVQELMDYNSLYSSFCSPKES